jgi:hypothetical protein
MDTDVERSELLTVKDLAREWRHHPGTIYGEDPRRHDSRCRLGDGTSALRIPRSELEAQLSAAKGCDGPFLPADFPAAHDRGPEAEGSRSGARGAGAAIRRIEPMFGPESRTAG